MIVILVAIFVAIAAIGYFAYVTTPPNVDVQGINVYAPDDVCGLSSNPVGYYGFNASAGSAEPLELQLENFNLSGSCTVRSVLTNTTGFSVTGIQVPDTVPAISNGTLNLTLNLPGSAYDGLVNLVFA